MEYIAEYGWIAIFGYLLLTGVLRLAEKALPDVFKGRARLIEKQKELDEREARALEQVGDALKIMSAAQVTANERLAHLEAGQSAMQQQTSIVQRALEDSNLALAVLLDRIGRPVARKQKAAPIN